MNTRAFLSTAERFQTSVLIESKKRHVDIRLWEVVELGGSLTFITGVKGKIVCRWLKFLLKVCRHLLKVDDLFAPSDSGLRVPWNMGCLHLGVIYFHLFFKCAMVRFLARTTGRLETELQKLYLKAFVLRSVTALKFRSGQSWECDNLSNIVWRRGSRNLISRKIKRHFYWEKRFTSSKNEWQPSRLKKPRSQLTRGYNKSP